jgi:phospholipid/cholesterol/gamma-HCH transport system substrate-binding protein
MTRLKILAAGLVATLGLTGCGFHGLYSANLPGGPNLGSHPFTVLIDFKNVLDLVPQSNVKLNDVAVGKVESVKLVGWIAQVKVKVNGNVDLPDNAQAAIRMTSLLGEKYVDLEQPPPGTGQGKLHSGSHIPVSATDTAPEVEEVLGAMYSLLSGGGLPQIQTIAQELNTALTGRTDKVRDLLKQLTTFTGTLDTQKDKITDALTKIDKLAVALNAQRKSIEAALDTFPQALQILKDERRKLTHLLQSLATLGNTATGILSFTPSPGGANVQSLFVDSLKQLQPVLENLTAAGSDLPKALQIMLTFPFPLGKATEFLRTDYANLGLHLNFSLNDNLCGLGVKALCDLINALSPTTGSVVPTGSSSTKSAPKTATAQPISLPGVDG